MTILIAGAGPSGLTLALSLSRQGIPYHLLDCGESADEKSLQSKDLTLSLRSLEIFASLGINKELIELGYSVKGLSVVSPNNDNFNLLFSDLEINHSKRLSISRKVFTDIVLKNTKIKIDKESELTDLLPRENDVVAQLKINGKIHKKSFRYVVGCDGAADKTRRMLAYHSKNQRENDPREDIKESLSSILIADITYKGDPIQNDALHLLKEGGFLVLSPLDKDRLRLVVSKSATRKTITTKDEASSVLKNLFLEPLEVDSILNASEYDVMRPSSSKFREGNIFFCGRTDFYDLSRLALGLDLDMQKAFRLGCFLGQAAKSMTSSHILETYDKERKFFRSEDQKLQRVTAIFLFSKNVFLTFLKRYLTPLLFRTSLLKKIILRHLGCLDIRYRVSKSFKETFFDYYVHPFGPKKGDLAPDGTFITDKGEQYTVSTLLKNFNTVAMIFSEKKPVEIDFKDLDVLPQQIYWISSFLNDPEKGTLHDPDGEGFKKYGVKNRSILYIVRPDGHIADRRLIF